MPTGYTCDVQSGKVTEFRDFAMACARAFGACIMMRDEPADTPISERFDPNTSYYDDSLARAKARLIELEAMTPEQADAASRAERDAEWQAIEERNQRRAVERRRYEAMQKHVLAWTPPSDEHVGLKDFMLDQLTRSIDFDCNGSYDKPAPYLSGDDWKAEQIRKARRDIEYHTKERAKEIERAEERTTWIRQLRESLSASGEQIGRAHV